MAATIDSLSRQISALQRQMRSLTDLLTAMNNRPDRLLSVSKTAEMLSCSNKKVYALINRGQLNAVKGEKSWEISYNSVQDYISSR